MLLLLTIPLATAAVAAVALHPRSRRAAALACAAAAAALAAAPDTAAVRATAAAVLPLAAFLAAAIWLSRLAAASGLASRLAGTLARRAGGSPWRLFVLVCLLCAALTAAVSLDGAVVLMAPVVLALSADGRLARPLLAATIAVANAFSIALPQGNPVNLIVMERLGLSPQAFTGALFLPALAATVTCAGVVALGERRALGAPRRSPQPGPAIPWSAHERLAASALAGAGALGAAAPWAGLGPWWPLGAVAVATAITARRMRLPSPSPAVPGLVCAQVAALSVAVGVVAAQLGAPVVGARSLLAVVALALAVGLVACLVNNLPAGIVAAGVLSAHPLTASAGLTGLAVGAVGTRHGSVATLLAAEGAGDAGATSARRHLAVFAPAAVLGTTAAALTLWTLGGLPC